MQQTDSITREDSPFGSRIWGVQILNNVPAKPLYSFHWAVMSSHDMTEHLCPVLLYIFRSCLVDVPVKSPFLKFLILEIHRRSWSQRERRWEQRLGEVEWEECNVWVKNKCFKNKTKISALFLITSAIRLANLTNNLLGRQQGLSDMSSFSVNFYITGNMNIIW